jgi:plasmid stabilization system protein ParE
LDDIVKYLSAFYEYTATRQYDRIIEKIRGLAQFPELYLQYQSAYSDVSYRRMVVDDYLVFYTVSESDAVVKIHRILNAKRDVGKLI